MTLKRITFLLALCCFASLMSAQDNSSSTGAPTQLIIKTNPLQYISLEFNLATELRFGRHGIEAKGSRFGKIIDEPDTPLSNAWYRGKGFTSHLMYRYYFGSEAKLFFGAGLLFKTWKLKDMVNEYYDWDPATDQTICQQYDSRSNMPGIKLLLGGTEPIFSGKGEFEFYFGAGLKYEFQRRHIDSQGLQDQGCTGMPIDPQPAGYYRYQELIPAVYLGIAIGPRIILGKK